MIQHLVEVKLLPENSPSPKKKVKNFKRLTLKGGGGGFLYKFYNCE